MHKNIGNNIVSDIHLGDWGMPVAQIITYCELEEISFDELTINMLEEIYPNASKNIVLMITLKRNLRRLIKNYRLGKKRSFLIGKRLVN